MGDPVKTLTRSKFVDGKRVKEILEQGQAGIELDL